MFYICNKSIDILSIFICKVIIGKVVNYLVRPATAVNYF